MSCQKAIVVITRRVHCFHDYIYKHIYIGIQGNKNIYVLSNSFQRCLFQLHYSHKNQYYKNLYYINSESIFMLHYIHLIANGNNNS